eukprot:m.48216 g.48216  ORF g.48216 m.48216 type:complete len:269 (+) comp11980_c0_seq1:316-1122(+)
MTSFELVPAASLFVSEPDPSWFGNGANTPSNSTWTNNNWLKSRFHFSFAEYHDSERSNFGVLRVMNDDLVQPDRGFGTHPHANMEICTYVIEGELTHQDSMGTQESLGRGSIQFMTAGTGVRHSEFNLSKDKPLRFIQMWIDPRTRGLKPNYGSLRGDAQQACRKNKFAHLVSDIASSAGTPVKINQDASIYVGEPDQATTLAFDVAQGRGAYLLCMEGTVDVAGSAHEGTQALERHDAARIRGANSLQITATSPGSHVLIVEMACSK